MARIADSSRFRAHAVRMDWQSIFKQKWGAAARLGRVPQPDDRLLASLREHANDIHLTWACSADLGVPLAPFTVWTRSRNTDKLKTIAVSTFDVQGDVGLWFRGAEAAVVNISCTVIDPSRPVAVFLHRSGVSLEDAVAAKAVMPAGPGTVQLRVECTGATFAVLVNGSTPTVSITLLDVVVNASGWKPFEIVGLPIDQPWGGTLYDPMDQGPTAGPVSPIEAAVMRVARGGPIIGWSPLTESGHLAPPWSAPDPKLLVEEVRKELLPEITGLYDGTKEFLQAAITGSRVLDGPQQGSRRSPRDATLDSGPWGLLMLPALSDPFLNLACGFGSAYSIEPLGQNQLAVGNTDFLVTATYRELAPPDSGPVEMAAYHPRPLAHGLIPDPTGLTVTRAGLVAPVVADAPWRESIRLQWNRQDATAGQGRVTESALARFDLAPGTPAESLLDPRVSGGWRPRVVMPDAPKGFDGYDRISAVDGGVAIPIGSGGRSVGYAVAISDIYGVWSTWQDVAYVGDEPAPQPPRVVSLALTTRYEASTSCPATLTTQVAVEWLERTPTEVEIVALFFPMALPTSPPPAGLSPMAATPAGCFRRDFGLSFVGDTPVGNGCSVVSLNGDGDQAMPPGPGQGNGGRRFDLTAFPLVLDFGATRRWGVQLWARRALAVGDSPSAFAPDPAHPALTSAASPVPVVPLPPPPPPGVPLGSTKDASGCSHVRVHWSLPAGADVRTVVVWEVAETSLRQRCGLPSHAPETDLPGVRLAALWAAYDAMTPQARRNAFRRVQELPGTARDLDFALPKGSTDIHLFVATTQTSTGVDSPWPAGPGAAHEHLQAVIAPRLRQPAPPIVRSSVADDGTVTLSLSAASSVPVTAFRVFRTRSEAAARNVETMGPAVLTVPVDSPNPAAVDSFTNLPIYTATWSGTFPAAWDAWLVRAIAVAVDKVPVAGVLGLPSEACDVVSLLAPPVGPPELTALAFDLFGGDHRGIVVRSVTTAPARPVTLGSHRLTATINGGAQSVTLTALADLAETTLTTPPTAAASGAVLERGVRASGHTALALWFTRPVAATASTIVLRLVDPLGRTTERTVTVPGWTPPPAISLQITEATLIAGRGVAVSLTSDAPVTAAPPFVIAVRAVQTLPGPRLPIPLPPGRPGGPFRPPRFRSLSASFPIDTIPLSGPGFRPGPSIQIVRLPDGAGRASTDYALWIPLTAPVRIDVTVTAPDGRHTTVSVSK